MQRRRVRGLRERKPTAGGAVTITWQFPWQKECTTDHGVPFPQQLRQVNVICAWCILRSELMNTELWRTSGDLWETTGPVTMTTDKIWPGESINQSIYLSYLLHVTVTEGDSSVSALDQSAVTLDCVGCKSCSYLCVYLHSGQALGCMMGKGGGEITGGEMKFSHHARQKEMWCINNNKWTNE